jgi:hypothetical protein
LSTFFQVLSGVLLSSFVVVPSCPAMHTTPVVWVRRALVNRLAAVWCCCCCAWWWAAAGLVEESVDRAGAIAAAAQHVVEAVARDRLFVVRRARLMAGLAGEAAGGCGELGMSLE